MMIKVHIYDDRLECFIDNEPVATLARKRRSSDSRVHQINYKHVVGSLLRKPQAFRHYIYKEELFPTLAFRETWERLNSQLDSKTACKEYIKILKEAADDNQEAIVNSFLEQQLLQNILPKSIDVQSLFRSAKEAPRLTPLQNDLCSYDALVRGA